MNKRYNFNEEEMSIKPVWAFTYSMVGIVCMSLLWSIITMVFPGVDPQNNMIAFFASFFIITLALFIGSAITYKVQGLQIGDVTQLKFKKIYILVIVLVGFGTFFGLSGVNDYFVMFLEKFGYKPDIITLPPKSFLSVAGSILFIAILPAVVEEFLFRGIMLKGAKNLGSLQAVFVTALAFSLYHMSPAQTIYQFVIGVIYALIALSSGSIIPTTILHFLNNFVIIMLNYFCPTFMLSGWVKIVLTIVGLIMTAIGLILALKNFKFEKIEVKKSTKLDYLIAILPGFIICFAVWVANLFV